MKPLSPRCWIAYVGGDRVALPHAADKRAPLVASHIHGPRGTGEDRRDPRNNERRMNVCLYLRSLHDSHSAFENLLGHRPWVPITIPSSSDIWRCFNHLDWQALIHKLLAHIDAPKARPNDDGIEVNSHRVFSRESQTLDISMYGIWLYCPYFGGSLEECIVFMQTMELQSEKCRWIEISEKDRADVRLEMKKETKYHLNHKRRGRTEGNWGGLVILNSSSPLCTTYGPQLQIGFEMKFW